MRDSPPTLAPLLQAQGLTVAYRTRNGIVTAVNDVALEVCTGESVALVGESGSGKSTVARAAPGLYARDPRGQQAERCARGSRA